ncbi:MAG: phosphate ABC transporter permease, partial [Anaerolineae bacterium]
MATIFQASTIFGIIVLLTLLYNIINSSFGLVAWEYKIHPDTLAVAGVPLEELPREELIRILQERVSANVLRRLEREKPLTARSQEELYALVVERVVQPTIVKTWSLVDSIFRRQAIVEETARDYPGAYLRFRSWLNARFLTSPQSSRPELAGVRTAILGSLWTVLITILFAFPLGVSAAIYLEEYASDNWLNRIIQTNINNLAGVPSIIYGMLGLAIFVRAMEP